MMGSFSAQKPQTLRRGTKRSLLRGRRGRSPPGPPCDPGPPWALSVTFTDSSSNYTQPRPAPAGRIIRLKWNIVVADFRLVVATPTGLAAATAAAAAALVATPAAPIAGAAVEHHHLVCH